MQHVREASLRDVQLPEGSVENPPGHPPQLDGRSAARYGLVMNRFSLRTWGSFAALLVVSPVLAVGEPPTADAGQSDLSGVGGVEKLKAEALLLAKQVQTSLAQEFLAAVPSLPRIETRTLYRNREKRQWFSAAATARLSAGDRDALTEFSADEDFFYYTAYGSPLVYVRVLDLAAKSGMKDLSGKRVMDFGYGSIGQVRLMASLGADVVGVDPSDVLKALYSEPSDQASVPRVKRGTEAGAVAGRPGKVTLVHRRWPAQKEAVKEVGSGYDLLTSKNTLKNGYLHPARPVDKRMLVDLGVSEAEFVKALFNALKPGGLVVIYNLSPAPSRDDEPYKPWSDGRCPFPREMWEQAGFDLIAFDLTDDTTARAIFTTLGYPTTTDAGRDDLFSHYTIARRPR